jgi:anti-anti-sigma factor
MSDHQHVAPRDDQILQISPDPGSSGRLVVRGEVDVQTAPLLERAVTDVFDAGTRHVTLDLADVGFIDSSGLRTLIALQRRAETEEGTLRLTPQSRAVMRLFEVTGLGELFPDR